MAIRPDFDVLIYSGRRYRTVANTLVDAILPLCGVGVVDGSGTFDGAA